MDARALGWSPLWLAVAVVACAPADPPRDEEPVDGRTTYDEPQAVSRHYLVANESRHDLFYPYIRGRGGIYVGVGSMQNYSMLASSGAEQAFLIDIDAQVVALHRLLSILIARSSSPARLRRRFAATHAVETLALLRAARADEASVDLFRAYRRELAEQLAEQARSPPSAPTWVSSTALYDRVRALLRADAITIAPGDLCGARTLRVIAQHARARGLKVRVLYLSNAEESLVDRVGYARNIQRLPRDERSVALRTLYHEPWSAADGLWSYQVQPLSDLAERLSARPRPPAHKDMILDARETGALRLITPSGSFSVIGDATVQ